MTKIISVFIFSRKMPPTIKDDTWTTWLSSLYKLCMRSCESDTVIARLDLHNLVN